VLIGAGPLVLQLDHLFGCSSLVGLRNRRSDGDRPTTSTCTTGSGCAVCRRPLVETVELEGIEAINHWWLPQVCAGELSS